MKVGDLVKWVPVANPVNSADIDALAIVVQIGVVPHDGGVYSDSWNTLVQWCDGTGIEDIAPYERQGDTFEVVNESR